MKSIISRFFQSSGNQPVDDQYKSGVQMLQRGNYKGAASVFRTTAAAGHVSSIFNLGLMHKQGLTETFDIEKAIDLFKEAAALGHDRARANYELLVRLGNDESLDNEDITNLMVNFDRTGGDGAFIYGLANEVMRINTDGDDLTEFVMMELDGASQGNESAQRFAQSTGIPRSRYAGGLSRSEEGTPPRQASDALDRLCIMLMQAGVPQKNVIFARCSIVGYVAKKSGIASMPSLLPFTAYR